MRRLCWSSGDAVVWCIDLLPPLPQGCGATLSDTERERAARFAHDADRESYLAAHHALRGLLAEITGARPGALVFGHGPQGKPFLVDHPDWHFSFSRRRSLALVGISKAGEIGVDVEMVGDVADPAALAEQVCSASERAQLAHVSSNDQAVAFATCWTRKEASLKAVGVGLSVDPSTIDVGLSRAPRYVRVAAPTGAVCVRVDSFMVHERSAGSIATVV
jgi:4'-phosphopantetheinyl transferase